MVQGCRDAPGPIVPTHLAFVTQPASVASMESLGNVSVAFLAPDDRVVTGARDTIEVSLVPAGEGAAIAGETRVGAIDGVASFPGLSVAKAGTGYRLVARSAGMDSVLSVEFQVSVGPAVAVRFEKLDPVTPYSALAGNAIRDCGASSCRALRVSVVDAGGNTVPAATHSISLAASGTAALSGTTTVSATGGVAEFPDPSLTKAGSYTLSASAANLGSATHELRIQAGPLSELRFLTQPTSATAGAALPPFSVAATDSYGNQTAPIGPSITYSLTLGNNPSNAALGGTTVSSPTPASVAYSFNDVRIDKAGAGYTLILSAAPLFPGAAPLKTATSAAFTITP